MKQKYLFKILITFFLTVTNSFSQTIIDDFTDANFTSNQTWSGSTASFTVINDATIPNGNATTDGFFLASNSSEGDVSLAFASTEVSEWRFSIASPNFDPSGSNYIGVVLMASAAFSGDLINDNTTNNFQGYYLRIGDAGSDPISLYRKTGSGEESVGDFPFSPSFSTGALRDGLNIRVTRSATGVFELFYSTGFLYDEIPATSAGTLTNNAYSTSSYFGVFQNIGSTSVSRRVYIDNIQLGVVTWEGDDVGNPNDWNTSSNWNTNILPTSTDNIVIPGGLTNYPVASSAVTVNSVIISSDATLIANNSFTGGVTYNRTLGTTNWYLMSSPVAGVTFNDAFVTANNIATGTQLANRGVGSYNTASNDWTYLQGGGSLASTAGIGYTVKQSSAGTVGFTGTINTSDVSVAVSNAGNGFNLIGNPFTAAINSATFLTDNSANLVSQTIWLFDQSTGNYVTKVTGDTFIVAPTQGFFVRSSNGTNLSIAESYQTTGGTFQKTNKAEVVINMTDGTNNRFAKLYYFDANASKGFDNGYDGETFSGQTNELDVFTHLLEGSVGKNYQVQSLPKTEMESMVVPVGIKATAGKELTFTADAMNLPNGLKVFLEDRETNTFTELTSTNNYKVTLGSDLNGIGRFFVHTASSVLSTPSIDLTNVNIYTTGKQQLRITGVNSDATVKVFNILGKQVFENSFSSKGVTDLNLPAVQTGVYIIQLTTTEGKLNKKIVLE